MSQNQSYLCCISQKDPSQKRRGEDAIIAWTWKEFMENNDDPYILLRMPMTKAAVRAMVTIYSAKRESQQKQQ